MTKTDLLTALVSAFIKKIMNGGRFSFDTFLWASPKKSIMTEWHEYHAMEYVCLSLRLALSKANAQL